MKKRKLLYILFVLVLLGSESCKDKSSDMNKSIEPNDKIEEANKVEIGAQIKMSIDKKGDNDWYKVEVEEQGYLQVSTNGVPEKFDICVRFAKYDEESPKKEDYLTMCDETPATVHVLDADTYYILVTDRWGMNFSEEEFTLKIDFIKEFDDFEPNNVPLLAKDVEFGQEYKSAIFPMGDEDWFKVTVEEQGYIEVKAKDMAEGTQLIAGFYQFNEYDEDSISMLKDYDFTPCALACANPGEYYIMLDGISCSQSLFIWEVNFIPEMDVNEPNDTKENAKEITGNDIVNLALFPKFDIDMFKFSPKKKSTLIIEKENFNEIDIIADVYILDANDALEKISSFEIPGKIEIPESGRDYYIAIKDDWNLNPSPELIKIIFTY